MKETAKMLIVLSLICGICGFLLAMVRSQTNERIEEQILHNVKGPAVKKVLSGSTNDLIKDRRTVRINEKEYIVFIGKKDNTPWAYAFETTGSGFGGEIGVITGFKLNEKELTGIGITTHKETPGVGARITEDLFTGGFRDRKLTDNIDTRADGGVIDGITGATISSRAVCATVRDAISISEKIQSGLKLE